jgi:hypothetical protein
LEEELTEYDLELVKIMRDPVRWVEYHLGLKPRWYQTQILRHPHNRIALRLGRRMGKTWTMSAHALWAASTGLGGKCPRGAKLIFATPYESQSRLIFDEMIKLIDEHPMLSDSIKSSTKSPFEIKFKNGSVIKLFTAGSKSGNAGGSMRGQAADWIYFDEMDYI